MAMNISKHAENLIESIILVIVIVLIVSALAATILSAFGNIAASGLPLVSSLFSPTGIVLTVIVLGIFIGLVYMGLNFIKKGK